MKRLLVLLPLLLGCPPAPYTPPPAVSAPTGSVAPIETGIAVAVVLDTSGSMEGDRLAAVKQVWAQTLSPKLRSYHQRHNDLQVVAIECGGEARVIYAPQQFDPDALDNVVTGLRSGGGTPLGEAMNLAHQQMLTSRKTEKHVFVLSDGEATGFDPALVLQTMKDRGDPISVYVVGFQSNAAYYQAFQDRGYAVMMAENPEELDRVSGMLFADILKPEAE